MGFANLTDAQKELLRKFVENARQRTLVNDVLVEAPPPGKQGQGIGYVVSTTGEIDFLMSDFYGLCKASPPLMQLESGHYRITKEGFRSVDDNFQAPTPNKTGRDPLKPNWIGIIAICVAVTGTILSFLVPEVRHALGLDRSQTTQNLTELASLPTTGVPTSTPEILLTITPPTTQASMIDSQGVTGYLIIYPACNCSHTITSADSIVIRLRLMATTEKLVEKGADRISYTAFLDERELTQIDNYRRPAVYEENSVLRDDPAGAWWVYWDIPIDPLAVGEHTIKAQLMTRNSIDTGFEILSTGTSVDYQVTIRVVPPNTAP